MARETRFIAAAPEDGGEIRDLRNDLINKVKNFENSAAMLAGGDEESFQEILKEKLREIASNDADRGFVLNNIARFNNPRAIRLAIRDLRDEYYEKEIVRLGGKVEPKETPRTTPKPSVKPSKTPKSSFEELLDAARKRGLDVRQG